MQQGGRIFMKRFWLCLILYVVFAGCNVLPMIASGSPVPDTLPEDFGGKTRYGYMMDLKNTYMPATVFSDAVKYSNSDRDNARRAIELLILAATQAMETAGAPDQYNLYMRAYSHDLKYQDTMTRRQARTAGRGRLYGKPMRERRILPSSYWALSNLPWPGSKCLN